MKLHALPLHFFFPFFLSCSTFLTGCTSDDPILTSNIDLTVPEQRQLDLLDTQPREEIDAASNLQNFTFPSEAHLLVESHIKDRATYEKSMALLDEWVSKSLSINEKAQLVKNCERMLGRYKESFPMNEKTLACSAWWIERQESNIKTALNNSKPTKATLSLNSSQKEDWQNYKNLSFADTFPNINPDSLETSRSYYQKALANAHNCAYKNATASMIFRLEVFLPNKEIYEDIEKLYNKSQKCFVPNEEPSEKVHLRIGLLRLINGKIQASYQALVKTQLETSPQENSRNLFWLGAIYQSQKTTKHKKADNPYWKRLLKENPESWSSIIASTHMGLDPMDMLSSDMKIAIEHRLGNTWNTYSMEAFLFELFYARRNLQTASLWAQTVAKIHTSTSPELLLYWSLAQNKVQNYTSSILFLGKYRKYKKDFLISRTMLDLQFPRVYLSEILSQKSNVDPLFVLSLMRQESAFDRFARSGANARGLMQMLPATATTLQKHVSAEMLYDPQVSISLGVNYLNKLFTKYNGQTEFVLASYNAGTFNLDKWTQRVPSSNIILFSDYIPFKETRNYVSIILRNYYWYGRIISESQDPLSKQFMLESKASKWKSQSVEALLLGNKKESINAFQPELLNDIYIFGNAQILNAEKENLFR